MLQLSSVPLSFRDRVERKTLFFTAAMSSNDKKSIHNHVLCIWRGLYNTAIQTLCHEYRLGHNAAEHE
jgi:hypothetical protein